MRWSLGLCLLTQLTDFVRLTKSNGRRYENIHKKLKTEKKKPTVKSMNAYPMVLYILRAQMKRDQNKN